MVLLNILKEQLKISILCLDQRYYSKDLKTNS